MLQKSCREIIKYNLHNKNITKKKYGIENYGFNYKI